MTTYRTKDDCCKPITTGTGGKRPTECVHGNHYYTERQLARDRGASGGLLPRTDGVPSDNWGDLPQGYEPKPRRRSLKRSEPKRDWTLARAKVEEENFCCRVCGAPGAEAAHILGRKFDQPISPGAKTLLVLPDRIVPLCPEDHGFYDAHTLDLLPFLTAAEQAQAILDAGSIGLALKRISPTLELAA
jgi:hypothetical protein